MSAETTEQYDQAKQGAPTVPTPPESGTYRNLTQWIDDLGNWKNLLDWAKAWGPALIHAISAIAFLFPIVFSVVYQSLDLLPPVGLMAAIYFTWRHASKLDPEKECDHMLQVGKFVIAYGPLLLGVTLVGFGYGIVRCARSEEVSFLCRFGALALSYASCFTVVVMMEVAGLLVLLFTIARQITTVNQGIVETMQSARRVTTSSQECQAGLFDIVSSLTKRVEAINNQPPKSQ